MKKSENVNILETLKWKIIGIATCLSLQGLGIACAFYFSDQTSVKLILCTLLTLILLCSLMILGLVSIIEESLGTGSSHTGDSGDSKKKETKESQEERSSYGGLTGSIEQKGYADNIVKALEQGNWDENVRMTKESFGIWLRDLASSVPPNDSTSETLNTKTSTSGTSSSQSDGKTKGEWTKESGKQTSTNSSDSKKMKNGENA